MQKQYFVYMLASKKRGTLYTGVTNSLDRRVIEHKEEVQKSFTQSYHVHRLVYYEIYSDVRDAIKREKQLKWWRRSWKIELIEKQNPSWRDFAKD